MPDSQSADGTYAKGSKSGVIIAFGVFCCGILIFAVLFYAAIARTVIIPELRDSIKSLEANNEQLLKLNSSYLSETKLLHEENSKLKMKVRWSEFLSMMLDENQVAQFNDLNKCLKESKNETK